MVSLLRVSVTGSCLGQPGCLGVCWVASIWVFLAKGVEGHGEAIRTAMECQIDQLSSPSSISPSPETPPALVLALKTKSVGPQVETVH